MSITPADEKLRQQQLRALRRKWLKDQELSPREPVLPPTKEGPIQRFWSNFLREKSLWRTYTFKIYRTGVSTFTRLLIPAWIIHYFLKYHLQNTAYGIVCQKPRLYPGDIIQETGEVIPPMEEQAHDHHHR